MQSLLDQIHQNCQQLEQQVVQAREQVDELSEYDEIILKCQDIESMLVAHIDQLNQTRQVLVTRKYLAEKRIEYAKA